MHELCVISFLPELSSVSGLADTFIIIRDSPTTSSKIDLNRSQPLSIKVVLLVGIVDGIQWRPWNLACLPGRYGPSFHENLVFVVFVTPT